MYLLPAILVAYSRIYLSQHFLSDVLAGSLLGVLVAFIVFYFFNIQARIKTKKITGPERNIYIDASFETASVPVETPAFDIVARELCDRKARI